MTSAWADRGSNVMAKGQDGFSPVGPAMAAADVDPATLHLTGLVNGEVRQDTTGEDLIFSFAQLVADLIKRFAGSKDASSPATSSSAARRRGPAWWCRATWWRCDLRCGHR